MSTEDAVSMIVNGFCKQVFKELPMEFAVEAQKLLEVSLEGSRRLMMLTIKNLHVISQMNKEILKGINLTIKAWRSACHYGTEWFW